MPTALLTPTIADMCAAELAAAADAAGVTLDLVTLPADGTPASEADLADVEVAFFSLDVWPVLSRSFFDACGRAPKLRWIHCFNAGMDHPVFKPLMARGIRFTTSSGATAKPIAQTAIGGMLMLARGFLPWAESQRRHAWEPLRDTTTADLDSQTMVVLGLGAIGNEIARLAQAIGLHVVGVRRSPQREGDHVDEMAPPSRLAEVLPRADWLALACPLTDETRGIIDARALALLPRGARIINIARGGVIDEAALISALDSGQLGGAYLDVFVEEPLPAESPLWEMPNVIVSPHNSAFAAGNQRRMAGYFVRNVAAWLKGEAMVNEVTPG